MNYYEPYLGQSELEDLLLQYGYIPFRHNNGYVRELKASLRYPRFHLHVLFHEQEDFIVLQLHFEAHGHLEGDYKPSVYRGEIVTREIKKLEQAVLYRLSAKARERG